MNSVCVSGFLGADPERKTAGSTALTVLRLGVRDFRKGEKVTYWFNVLVWGDDGERAARHLHKGSGVEIVGRLQNDEWTDKQGQKRVTTEIVATRWDFSGPPPDPSKRGTGDDDEQLRRRLQRSEPLPVPPGERLVYASSAGPMPLPGDPGPGAGMPPPMLDDDLPF